MRLWRGARCVVTPLCALATILIVATLASAQRVQFATPAAPADPFAQPLAPNPYPAPPPAGGYPIAPNPYPALPPTMPAFQPPVYQPPPAGFDPYAVGPGGSGAPVATPYQSVPFSATPSSIYPPSGSPYAPGAVPYAPGGSQAGAPTWNPADWLTPAGNGERFLRELRVENTWLAPFGGNDKLGVDNVDLSATFQFPLFNWRQPPLLVTPGFAFNFWDGPVSAGPGTADLPAETYDAYLGFAWNPEITPWLAAELNFSMGVYSDFHLVSWESVRFIGGGDAVITISPIWRVKIGAEYIDRLRVKLLPIAGVVYTPNEDTRWELVFPRPKISNRLNPLGTTSLWWYVAGEYGGGNWTIRRTSGLGDDFDYNDIRIQLGIEWATPANWKGMFEIGYVFNRELLYQSGAPASFDPSSTIELRAGLAF